MQLTTRLGRLLGRLCHAATQTALGRLALVVIGCGLLGVGLTYWTMGTVLIVGVSLLFGAYFWRTLRIALGTLILTAFSVGAIGWLVFVFSSSGRKLNTEELSALEKPRTALALAVAATLGDEAQVRVEPRGGNNVMVYLKKQDFESVPYPDRAEFVKAVGEAWCQNIGNTVDSDIFLPSVELRDIRTGDELGSYNCVLGR